MSWCVRSAIPWPYPQGRKVEDCWGEGRGLHPLRTWALPGLMGTMHTQACAQGADGAIEGMGGEAGKHTAL